MAAFCRAKLVIGWPFCAARSRAHERPGRPVIGDVLFHGLALTKQALDNSLSETGIAIRFSESVYLFRSPGTCYSGPSESVKQSVQCFRVKAVDRCGARS